ncbi:phage portal protein [Clostridium botulinum]|nr:phage portal protein [Clostridium botulinum]
MIFDKLEKRSSENGSFDWSGWIKGEDAVQENVLKEQNYLMGLNILGNTIAKLPITIKQISDNGEIEAKEHYLWDLLRLKANDNMNIFECIKSFIMLYKHNGMSGLYIDRDIKGKIIGLYPCKITGFTIDNAGLIKSNKQNKVLVNFDCAGVQGSCFDKDIIILRDNSLDGINCKATKSYIKDSIITNLQAQAYQKDLFSNGLTNKVVVQMTSDVKDEKEKKKVQDRFNKLYSAKGRIFTVPAGYNVQPLNLSLVDSQFAELKLSGKKDIASALNIPFNLIDNGTMTEQESITFLTNAIQPILTCLEQEMDWKLLSVRERKRGYKIRFNVNAMLRVSAEQQKNILCDYLKNGVYTTNNVRDILGLERVEGGDTILYPSGQITLENLINGNATWQKDNKSNMKGGDENE